jgi:acyl-CoA hydrolase
MVSTIRKAALMHTDIFAGQLLSIRDVSAQACARKRAQNRVKDYFECVAFVFADVG